MMKRYNPMVFDQVNKIHLKLSDFGYILGSSEWEGGRYPSSVSRLYYIIAGDQSVEIDGDSIPLEAGKCYLIPSGCFFGWKCETLMENLYFHITLSDISGIDLLKKCGRIMVCDTDPAVVERMKEYVISGRLQDSLLLRQELYSTLFAIFAKYGFVVEAPQYSHEVHRALEYISKHLSSQLSVEDIAANAFVSVSTLSKKFRSELYMTVSEYIENAVMKEAEMLLLSSNLTIQQISGRLDFCYQSYFTRRFKRWCGQTPQQFRKYQMQEHAVRQETFTHVTTRVGDYEEIRKRR